MAGADQEGVVENEPPEVPGCTLTVGLLDSAQMEFGADGKSCLCVSRAAMWASICTGGVPAAAGWGMCKNKVGFGGRS